MLSSLKTLHDVYDRVRQEIDDPVLLVKVLLKLYYDIVVEVSDASGLQFNTLFARVSFLTSHYQLNRAWSYALQIPRKELHHRSVSDAMLLPILQADIELLFLLSKDNAVSLAIQKSQQLPPLPAKKETTGLERKKKTFARVIAVAWDREKKWLEIIDDDSPDTTAFLHYHVHGVNDLFSQTLELALLEVGLPMVLGLCQIEITDDGQYTPGYILLWPDLLIDVTAVAGYTAHSNTPAAFNLIDWFKPNVSNAANLAGKVANYFLDELLRDTTQTFDQLFLRSFKIYPVEFVQLDDEKLRAVMAQLRGHYQSIRDVILQRFPALNIDRERCVIEPSYFSPQYGIKGRLDVFYHHPADQTASIIELKSGKPFKPNPYGLSHSHYHQTLLYELLIRAAHSDIRTFANFVLYSTLPEQHLKFAVSIESIQKEAIQNRNELSLLHHQMMSLGQPHAIDVFASIDPDAAQGVTGFLKTDIQKFYQDYHALSEAEKSYFRNFAGFITREHTMARIGSETDEGTGGLAALWLNSIALKEERYQILQRLRLDRVEQDAQQTILWFAKSTFTNPLANFRAGDIAILYPYSTQSNPTHHQLHRASILSLTQTHVEIRLRNTQIHLSELSSIAEWNVEHDLLDSSFKSLYQSLWMLMTTDQLRRRWIMGYSLPKMNPVSDTFTPDIPLHPQQRQVWQEGIAASFLYLLWGPPGTGKTSIMLRAWVEYYMSQTSDRILLLAYTNRAVDEICSTLSEMDETVAGGYLRIGSRNATGEVYRNRLWDHLIAPLNTRAEIHDLLLSTRIVVGTVASVQGKWELFDLIPFDIAIVDEASQLLEPAVAGILTRIKKNILIGDHMQLPAVATQSEQHNLPASDEVWASQIGLTDLRMSYFERMYRHYQEKGWTQLIGTLYAQGRMHQDIMAFPNQYVYQGKLQCIEGDRYRQSLSSLFAKEVDPLFQHRMIYVPSKADVKEVFSKTNQSEAAIIIDIIDRWKKTLHDYQRSWSIGVITPFRAQIGAITHLAHQRGLDLEDVTIDTVERYQGGAKDIIIMSCAVNHQPMLSRISSLNKEGVDRKLNVAVTRAREQFILTGVEEVLSSSVSYAQLIAMSERMVLDYDPQPKRKDYQPEA